MPVHVWQLLIYRLPANPSRTRVAVWRELRRLGALPLQQSVVAVPEVAGLADQLDAIESRIAVEGGLCYRYRLSELTPEQDVRLTQEWNAIREHEYAEIMEECDTKFRREIEFELFRGNLTGSEAEEIEADLEKIRAWFARVEARDCFGAANKAAAVAAIDASQRLLDDFVERVFEAEAAGGGISLNPPTQVAWEMSGSESEQPANLEPRGGRTTGKESPA